MKRRKWFYGWMITALLMFAGVAVSSLTYVGSYINANMVISEGLNEAVVGFTSTAITAGTAILAAPTGALATKLGYRKLMLIGTVSGIAGAFLLIALPVSSYLAVGTGLMLGISSITVVVIGSPGLLNRWFKRNRIIAIPLMMAASPASGFLLSPFVSRAVTRSGWRSGYWILLTLNLALLVLFLLFLKDDPSEIGEVPDGHAVAARDPDLGPVPAEAGHTAPAVPARQPRKGIFWTFAVSSAGRAMLYMGCSSYCSMMALSYGFSSQQAALVLSVFSMGGLCGRLFPPLLRKLSLRDSVMIRIGSLLCLLGGLAFFFLRSLTGLIVAAAMIAVGYGLAYAVSPILLGEWYEGEDFSKNYGMFITVLQVGYTLGPLLVSVLNIALKGYQNVFLVFGVMSSSGIFLRYMRAAD